MPVIPWDALGPATLSYISPFTMGRYFQQPFRVVWANGIKERMLSYPHVRGHRERIREDKMENMSQIPAMLRSLAFGKPPSVASLPIPLSLPSWHSRLPKPHGLSCKPVPGKWLNVGSSRCRMAVNYHGSSLRDTGILSHIVNCVTWVLFFLVGGGQKILYYK